MSSVRETSVYTWEEVEQANHLWTVEFEITWRAESGRPARVSGPPEDCYPADPSTIEAEKITPLTRQMEGSIRLGQGPLLSLRPRLEITTYWLKRFEKEVASTEDFREWLWGQLEHHEDEEACRADDAWEEEQRARQELREEDR